MDKKEKLENDAKAAGDFCGWCPLCNTLLQRGKCYRCSYGFDGYERDDEDDYLGL